MYAIYYFCNKTYIFSGTGIVIGFDFTSPLLQLAMLFCTFRIINCVFSKITDEIDKKRREQRKRSHIEKRRRCRRRQRR